MSTLVHFLIWGGFFFVMMRFGCGAHIMGHSKNHRHGDENQNAPKTVSVTDTPPTRNMERNNDHQH